MGRHPPLNFPVLPLPAFCSREVDMSHDVQYAQGQSPGQVLPSPATPKQQQVKANQHAQGYRPRHAAPEWDDTVVTIPAITDEVIERMRYGTQPVSDTKRLLVPVDPRSHRQVTRAPGAALAAQQHSTRRDRMVQGFLQALHTLRRAAVSRGDQ